MLSLGWKDFFKALVPAGLLGYLLVAISGTIWVGPPAFMGFSWLFHDFRKKITTFKRIFKEELPREIEVVLASVKSWAEDVKKDFWDKNQAKIYSFIITPIIILLVLMILLCSFDPGRNFPFIGWIFIVTSVSSIMFLCWLMGLVVMCLAMPGGDKITDGRIGKIVMQLPKFIFWQIWKFLFKVIILTIRKVHSRESAAVAIYGLSGMIYVIVFPPFQLVPVIQFLLGIGCGFFMSFCGLAMHKVLSTVFAQAIFAKADAW